MYSQGSVTAEVPPEAGTNDVPQSNVAGGEGGPAGGQDGSGLGGSGTHTADTLCSKGQKFAVLVRE